MSNFHATAAGNVPFTAEEEAAWAAEQAATLAAKPGKDKGAKWEAIKIHRDKLSDTGGYKVVVGGVDKWFHSDAKSKVQQIGLVLMGAAAANVPPWKTMDGTFVAMSPTLAGQIFTAASTMDGALFAAAETHRAAMEASADPAAYDFSGGWPAVFGVTI